MNTATCKSCEHYRPGERPFQCAQQQTGAPNRRAEHCKRWEYLPGSDEGQEAEGEG